MVTLALPQLPLHWYSWAHAQCTGTHISSLILQPRVTSEHKPSHHTPGITARAGSAEFNSGHNQYQDQSCSLA